MDLSELTNKAKELDSICKQFNIRITCRVSNRINEYETMVSEEEQTRDTHEKVYAFIRLPSNLMEGEFSLKQLIDSIYKFNYVSRVFIEFSKT